MVNRKVTTPFTTRDTARQFLTPHLRAELRDLLALAWDDWVTPSVVGPERAARRLQAGKARLVLAKEGGESPPSLWALLAEIRPEAKPHEFDAMLDFFADWEGGQS